jgi:hypothetical protein
MRKILIDDGFQSYLTEGAEFIGDEGIPMMLDLRNTEIPNGLVSFAKCKKANDKRQYLHFYIHDYRFASVLTSTKRYLELFRSFDGVIAPDPTIMIGQSKCLQATNVYFSRAVGYYLQRNGIPVIPNARWGEESTYSFAFSGIPKHSIVAVGSNGCMAKDKSNASIVREAFKKGLPAMLNAIEPEAVVVYGRMPEDIFGPYKTLTKFVRFPSESELAHEGGNKHGI